MTPHRTSLPKNSPHLGCEQLRVPKGGAVTVRPEQFPNKDPEEIFGLSQEVGHSLGWHNIEAMSIWPPDLNFELLILDEVLEFSSDFPITLKGTNEGSVHEIYDARIAALTWGPLKAEADAYVLVTVAEHADVKLGLVAPAVVERVPVSILETKATKRWFSPSARLPQFSILTQISSRGVRVEKRVKTLQHPAELPFDVGFQKRAE